MISRLSAKPGHPVTSMHWPGGMAAVVVHCCICGCDRFGLHEGNRSEFSGKCTMRNPAGAAVRPWLQTGMVPLQGTPTVRSTPAQLASVSPGNQGTQCPVLAGGEFVSHRASQTLLTLSTQLCDQVGSGGQPPEQHSVTSSFRSNEISPELALLFLTITATVLLPTRNGVLEIGSVTASL